MESRSRKTGVKSCVNWYDYGAKFYDPALGRFTTIDPLAEKYNFQSNYLYAYNNPIRYTDFLGMGADDEVDKKELVSENVDKENKTVTITERNIESSTEEGTPVVDESTGTTTTTSTTTVTKTVSRSTINEAGDVEHSESVTYSASQTTTTVTDKNGNIISKTPGDIVKNKPVAGNIVGEIAKGVSLDIKTTNFTGVMFKRSSAGSWANAATLVGYSNQSPTNPQDMITQGKNVQISTTEDRLKKSIRRADSLQRENDSLKQIIKRLENKIK